MQKAPNAQTAKPVDIKEYRRLNRRELYRSPWVAVDVHGIVHPSGVPGEHVLIVTPQSCGIVVEDRGDLLFAVQPRFAAERDVIEIVKGGSDADELPLDCAKRELREELGVTAHRWSDLGILYEIPSIVAPPVALFLARDLGFGSSEPAAEESISTVRLSIAEALKSAACGEIDDAVTLAALLRFAVLEGRLTA